MKRIVAFVLLVTFVARTGFAQPQPQVDQATKDDARSHFEQGLSHFDREEWSAALAEFLRSREIFPTRAATKNAATCLRKEKRYDEALDMFETLLRDFSDISPADKSLAEREIADLRAAVGTLEIRGAEAGTSILVDGRSRGNTPLAQPLRVAAGSHVVRAYKEGFSPFETRVDVAGKSAVAIDVRLQALTRGGRLKVTENSGKALDVVVDNVVVGKAPWEGAIAVGDHVVILRGGGEDNVGTQPVAAPVRDGQLTPLTLVAEPLDGQARVVPTPAGASVAIDGVTVGRGVWEGRLKVGAHKIEVGADGFLPATRPVTLEKDRRAVIAIELERDRQSALWAVKNPPMIYFEVDGALALTPLFGGDIASGLPLGFRAVGHGGYELGSGLGFGVDVGYLSVSTTTTDRATSTQPTGLAPNQGTSTDALKLSGLTVGASAMYHSRGTAWPFTVRLGAGILLGSVNDARTGRFTNSKGDVYTVDVSQAPSVKYLVVSPEARLGHRFGDHFEVSLGVEVGLLLALGKAEWAPDASPVLAKSPTGSGDGQATFAAESLVGSTLLNVAPGLGLRYDF